MSDAFHHIAVASLPVALGLLVLAAGARAVLWTDVNDAGLTRIARDHLGPLSTWCLILVAVHTVALGGAGDLGAGSGGVALIIGAAAVLLRAEDGGPAEEPDDAPEWAVAARERAATPGAAARGERAAAPAPAAAPRSLWVEPDEEPASRTGLWT
jgi:hypothetical protein